MGQTLDKIESTLGTLPKKVSSGDDSKSSRKSSGNTPKGKRPSPQKSTNYDYQHLQSTFSSSSMSSRLHSSIVSYPQLVADIRMINFNYSPSFVDAKGFKWRFHLLSKMSSEALQKSAKDPKGEWTKGGNVIVTAIKVNAADPTPQLKDADSEVKSPSSFPPSVSPNSPPSSILPSENSSSSLSSPSPSVVPSDSLPPPSIPPSNSTPTLSPSLSFSSASVRYLLPLKDFYFIFLYFADHSVMMTTGMRKIRGESNNNVEDGGEGGNDECSICMSNGIGIALKCGHGFCRECIEDWVEHHDQSCPLCRQAANIEENDNWDILGGDGDSQEAVKKSLQLVVEGVDQWIGQHKIFQENVIDTRIQNYNNNNGNQSTNNENRPTSNSTTSTNKTKKE